MIEELGAQDNNATSRCYTGQPEGVDLDAPLSIFDLAENKTCFYHTDANKNVTELTDSEGAVVAHYEYSPFGMVTKLSGDYAATNPFRFSSEYHDSETGLVYYNYRYYDPQLGRWLSRDPVEEKGGENLYGIVKNDPNNYWDENGLLSFADIWNGFWDAVGIGNLLRDWGDKGEAAARGINDLSTLADPTAPLQDQAQAVTDGASACAEAMGRNNEAADVQNFGNAANDPLTEIQNSLSNKERDMDNIFRSPKDPGFIRNTP